LKLIFGETRIINSQREHSSRRPSPPPTIEASTVTVNKAAMNK